MSEFFSGIKFFSNNSALLTMGGSVSATHGNATASHAFNGSFDFGWRSEGAADDLTIAKLTRTFDSEVEADTIIVCNHNLKDPIVTINGARILPDPVLVTHNGFTVATFNKRSDISSIRVCGCETIVPNEEKSIGEVMLLSNLGQFSTPQALSNDFNREQGELTLQNGKKFIFDCGQSWEFEISIFALDDADIALAEKISRMTAPFYMWPCGGNIDQFKYSFSPFKFEDIYKVSVVKGNSPNLSDNMYWTGLHDKIRLVEVE